MARTLCPCCHRPMPKAIDTPKPIDSLQTIIDTLDMTDRQLYAYYKRTAPASELAFTRRNASPELQAKIDTIAKPTAKDAALMREYRRIELAEAERAAGIPAIGSERWREAVIDTLDNAIDTSIDTIDTPATDESEAA